MTSAALVAAIRKVAPKTDMTLAIAIANQSLGYGRAYGVAPEVVAAQLIHSNATHGNVVTWARMSAMELRTVPLNRPERKLAAKLRAAAAGAVDRRYGAE